MPIRRVRAMLLTIGGIAVVAYAGIALALALAQRSLLYFPDPTRVDPAGLGLRIAERVLDAPDGTRLVTWQAAAAPGQPTLFYFHGNGGNLANRAARFAALQARGIGLVALSWRGYGGSTGTPSEDALLADALHVYDALRAAGMPAQSIVPFGESLGTAVAVYVAAHREVGAVVLQSPFTTMTEVAQWHYPLLPVSLALRDTYRASDWIGRVQAPLFVIHGRRDTIVPFTFGARLFELATAPKRLVAVDNGGHNDLDREGLVDAVAQFLADPPREGG